MKRVMTLFVASAFVGGVHAATEQTIEPTEDMKLCYYADSEYSLGSRLKQAGVNMECVVSEEHIEPVWRARQPEESA